MAIRLLSNDFIINTTNVDNERPELTGLSGDRFVVVWHGADGMNRGRVFNADGTISVRLDLLLGGKARRRCEGMQTLARPPATRRGQAVHKGIRTMGRPSCCRPRVEPKR